MTSALLLWMTSSSTSPLPTPHHLIDHVACESQPPVIARVATLDERDYLAYSRTLRREALERAAKRSRARARAAVIELVATRAGVPLPGTSAGRDCPPRLSTELLDLFRATESSDAGRLQAALRSPDLATRLVAANSIAHLGVIPDAAQVEGVMAAMKGETQPDVHFEVVMALAAQAQRNKEALPRLRAYLLASTTKAALARRIVYELPGEDLRFRLFHDLKKVPGQRAQAVRGWIQATSRGSL